MAGSECVPSSTERQPTVPALILINCSGRIINFILVSSLLMKPKRQQPRKNPCSSQSTRHETSSSRLRMLCNQCDPVHKNPKCGAAQINSNRNNKMEGLWFNLGSIMATFFFIRSLGDFLPSPLHDLLHEYCLRFFSFLSPFVTMKIEETEYDGLRQSEMFAAVHEYLSEMSCSAAKSLLVRKPKNSREFSFSADKNQRVEDEFQGVRVRWVLRTRQRSSKFLWWNTPEERRFYELIFHRRHKRLVVEKYLQHIMEEAKAMEMKRRQRKIFTNCGKGDQRSFRGDNRSNLWLPVVFDHPSTFETLALDPELKDKIVKDLERFRNGEEYYRRVGRAWKRGFLLYGPPGTGKSSMIAAMANYLEYDVYDLELTQVKNNTDLRKLLISTSDKSIIVVEDIDCSLDLSDRKKQKEQQQHKDDDEGAGAGAGKKEEENGESRVTLSGVLNFTDGLWSCCGSERIFIFTTNHVERLDPALLRSGRMDMHIELSYCCFAAFKILASNYLAITEHQLFGNIESVIEDACITPADIAEHFMSHSDEPRNALQSLLEQLLLRAKAGAGKALPECSISPGRH